MKILKILFLSLFIIGVASFCFACDDNENTTIDADSVYIVQYIDNNKQKSLEVKTGEFYSLETVPNKIGYDFLGLYNADGIRIVNEFGVSIAPFENGKNLVLYPKYKAKTYTVVLDYGDAEVTDARQLDVTYGQSLPELPKSLSLNHMVFKGWYTKQNAKGIKVADRYGIVPVVSVVNETNFELSGDYIYLYAGFEWEQFTIIFNGDNGEYEEVLSSYGSPISGVECSFRKEGEAVLSWSKTVDKTDLFNGKVTDDLVLYAVEYAPYIQFETNGGSKVNTLVKREGTIISLPEPTKEGCVFSRWMTEEGDTYSDYVMPASSLTLYAEWLYNITFDENGGSGVTNLLRTAGSAITLPKTEKEGYIFAGWYTSDGRKYETTVMPQYSLNLTAKYYKYKTKEIQIVDENESVCPSEQKPVISSSTSKLIDVSDIYGLGVRDIKVHIKYKTMAAGSTSSKTTTTWLNFYYADENDYTKPEEQYLIMQFSEKHIDGEWHSFEYTAQAELKSAKMYCAWFYTGNANSYWSNKWSNVRIEISYPIMDELF